MTYCKTRRESCLAPVRQFIWGIDFSPSAGCLASSWLATRLTPGDCCSCPREGNGLAAEFVETPQSRDIAPRNQSSPCAARLEIDEKIHFASKPWLSSPRVQARPSRCRSRRPAWPTLVQGGQGSLSSPCFLRQSPVSITPLRIAYL